MRTGPTRYCDGCQRAKKGVEEGRCPRCRRLEEQWDREAEAFRRHMAWVATGAVNAVNQEG